MPKALPTTPMPDEGIRREVLDWCVKVGLDPNLIPDEPGCLIAKPMGKLGFTPSTWEVKATRFLLDPDGKKVPGDEGMQLAGVKGFPTHFVGCGGPFFECTLLRKRGGQPDKLVQVFFFA